MNSYDEEITGNNSNDQENIQIGGADQEEDDATSESDLSDISFIDADDQDLNEINVADLTDGHEPQIIYNDEESNLSLKIKKLRLQRETNFLEDHLFEISVTQTNRNQRPPFLFSLLMIFRTALIYILNELSQLYDEQNNHQMYLTVIDDSINHGLNTGNYNVRTNPEIVTERVLGMLYNFLTSNMSLRLNQSFRFNIKVLSLRHARERVQRGGFRPHLLNGTNFTIKKKKYYFYLPKGFEEYEEVFSKNCLLLSIIFGNYLNSSLEIGQKSFNQFKYFSDINSKKLSKQKRIGICLLKEVERICLDNEITNLLGPHSLEEIAPKLTNYFGCQLIVFNNLLIEKIAYLYPPKFDETKKPIYLFQEISANGNSHVYLINKIKSFQRFNFKICLYCEKAYKGKDHIFHLHKCQKRITCENCHRYKANEKTYINHENKDLYCIEEKEDFQCKSCDKKINNKHCLRYHKCSEFFCFKCKRIIKRSIFTSIEKSKKSHKCEEEFCMSCKIMIVQPHFCKLKKTEIDKYQPALGFFNFQIVNLNNSSCFECFQNKDLLRKSLGIEWSEFLKIDANDKDIKKQYLCENHMDKNLNEDSFVNLATLKLEMKERGTFETMIFFEDELIELKNSSFKKETHRYCNLPIFKEKIPKKFGKSKKTSDIFNENLEILKNSACKTPVEKMILKLLEFTNTTLICFGIEQMLFVYKCFIDNGLEVRSLIVGRNILSIELEVYNLRFLNLQNYFKIALNDLIDQFHLNMKRIYFPEVLNNRSNYNLISLMPGEFPIEFYLNFNDTLKEKEHKKQFVLQNKDIHAWHFQKKLLEYSLYQTNLIMLASLKFCSNAIEFQKIISSSLKNKIIIDNLTLPFARNFTTISSFIYNIFKFYYVDPLGKLFVVKNEFPKKIQSSKEEMEFAAFLEHKYPQKIFNNVFSLKNERHFTRAIADVLCQEEKLIYFFNGCVVHGHDPAECPITSKKKNKTYYGRSFEELRKEFFDKMNYISLNYIDFKIEILWQCQWRKMKQTDPFLKDFLKTYIPWPTHHISPREAVRGARIEAFKLKWKFEDHPDEKMYYVDCSSLYPYMG